MRKKHLLLLILVWMTMTHALPTMGQSLAPIEGIPPTLKSLYYDIDGDGIQEYLYETNKNGDFYAWHSLDGAIKQKIADYSDTCYHVITVMELNGDGQPEVIFGSNGKGNQLYVSQAEGSKMVTIKNYAHSFTPVALTATAARTSFSLNAYKTGLPFMRPSH